MLKTEDLKLIYNPEPESLNPGALHHEVLCSKLHSGLLHLHSSRTDTVDSLRAAHGARRRSLKPHLSHKLGFGSQFCFLLGQASLSARGLASAFPCSAPSRQLLHCNYPKPAHRTVALPAPNAAPNTLNTKA